MINNWKRVLIDGAPEVFDKGQGRHKQDDAFHGIRLVETPVSVKILAADHLQRVQRASAARPPPSAKKVEAGATTGRKLVNNDEVFKTTFSYQNKAFGREQDFYCWTKWL